VQGIITSQYNLALMYGKGNGVVQDYISAHMWANLVAASGDKDGAKLRESIATVMTPQQIGEAQKLARECQARQFKGCN